MGATVVWFNFNAISLAGICVNRLLTNHIQPTVTRLQILIIILAYDLMLIWIGTCCISLMSVHYLLLHDCSVVIGYS